MSRLYEFWPWEPIWLVPWPIVIGLIVVVAVVEAIKTWRKR